MPYRQKSVCLQSYCLQYYDELKYCSFRATLCYLPNVFLQTNPATLQIKVITAQGHFEAVRPLTLNLQTWGRQSAI